MSDRQDGTFAILSGGFRRISKLVDVQWYSATTVYYKEVIRTGYGFRIEDIAIPHSLPIGQVVAHNVTCALFNKLEKLEARFQERKREVIEAADKDFIEFANRILLKEGATLNEPKVDNEDDGRTDDED